MPAASPSPTSTPGCRRHGTGIETAATDHRGLRRALRRDRQRARRGRWPPGRGRAGARRSHGRGVAARGRAGRRRRGPRSAPAAVQPAAAPGARRGRGGPRRRVHLVAGARAGIAADVARGIGPRRGRRAPRRVDGSGRHRRVRRAGAVAVVHRRRPDRAPARRRLPGRGPAARRLAPADHLHGGRPDRGRGPGAEPAVAGGQLLPAGAGAAARVGRRQRLRHPARALPADPQRPAHRARPDPAGRAAGGAVGPDPPGAHPGPGRRSPQPARAGRGTGPRPEGRQAPGAVGDRRADRQPLGAARGGPACAAAGGPRWCRLRGAPGAAGRAGDRQRRHRDHPGGRRRLGPVVDDRPVRADPAGAGRRAEERHRRQPRHRHGLRRLAQPGRLLRGSDAGPGALGRGGLDHRAHCSRAARARPTCCSR